MRYLKTLILLLSAFCLIVFVAPVKALDTYIGSTQFEGSEQIKGFQNNIVIHKDGVISVKETIYYSFGSLYKHGIYRDIPKLKTNKDNKKYVLKFSHFQVTDENNKSYPFSQLSIDDNIRLKIGDADKTITGDHTYVISYDVLGALTYFSDHDELYWNSTGNEWNVPIVSAQTTIELPSEVDENSIKVICYTGLQGSQSQACSGRVRGYYADASTKQYLNPEEGLTFAVSFPKNIVAVVEPQEYKAFSETWYGKIILALITIGITLAVLFWYVVYPLQIIYKWWKYGRDPSTSSAQVRAWFDPPKTPDNKRFLTPAEVGTLGDETVDMKDISSMIVDLARRGFIRIDERKKGDFYFVKMKDFDSNLLSFEKKLLKGMFGAKKEIRVKDEELYETVNETKTSLYENVVDVGLFPKNPQSIRNFYTAIGALALFTGNFFLAIVAFIFGRNMPIKTIEGVNAKNIAFSLKNFLTSQERQLSFQAKNQMMFEKLLPFAIAFGVETIWAKRFANIALKQPDWYSGYGSGNFNSVIFASSLHSSMNSFSTASRPPTSTTSSSGFSSGFSGGSSGGGGGGGGGGSW